MYKGSELSFFDFTGGLASSKFGTIVADNQATMLYNVVIQTTGGIEKRRGDVAFNSSAMVDSTTPIAGLGSFNALSGTEYLVAVAGSKIFQSATSSGTMSDITGAVVISAGQNNIWDNFVFNDTLIGVGGAPSAPWKWTGAGNAAALGGSPPSGNFGFQINNRVFIGNTAANPSRIAWSILSNAEDWSGVGSGSSDVWTNDGDNLVGAAPLDIDNVLLFKQRSIHKMQARNHPFPVFPVFKGIGAVGKHAIVIADGVCYFITPQARMKATDGSQIIEFTDDIDDVWESLNKSRLPYIQGVRYTGNGFDWIIWGCSSTSSTTNDLCIVWDLKNKCWLKNTSGFKCNTFAKIQNGTLYAGHYDGKIYQKDVANTYSDASETTPGAINGLWRTKWFTNNSFQISLHPNRLNVGMVSQTAGNLTVAYGYDFATDQITETVNMQSPGGLWDQAVWDQDVWGGQSDLMAHIFLKNRGNAFQLTFSNNSANQVFKVHGFTITGKKSGQKVFQAV